MSDIFREVEEEVRKERLEKLWKKYGDYIIAGVAVVVLGVGGYKLWQHYEQQQRAKASAAFSAAMQMSDVNKHAAAAETFANIAKEAPGGYAEVAKLSQADALMASGKNNQAIALYLTIAKDDSEIGHVARIRAAWAQADTATKAELQTLLAPLTDPKSGWRFMAREILAYSDFRDGHIKQAESEYQSLAKETGATAGLRQRAAAMATLLRTSGGGDYGVVPPPPDATADNPAASNPAAVKPAAVKPAAGKPAAGKKGTAKK